MDWIWTTLSSVFFKTLKNCFLGEPIVTCERDFVNIKISTKKPFKGRIFVKGEFSNADCVKKYSGNNFFFSVKISNPLF